jgi:hypothetical protein
MKTIIDITKPQIKLAEAPDQQRSITFTLKDARVHGEHILIADPLQWQKMEEDHVTARVM